MGFFSETPVADFGERRKFGRKESDEFFAWCFPSVDSVGGAGYGEQMGIVHE
jgi:hypothetical protein